MTTNNEIREFDIVISLDALGEIPSGIKGTIVNVYPNETYEVEFVFNNTSFVETVTKTQLRKTN
jgi:hypothetical protein